MIYALGVSRELETAMFQAWQHGKVAADHLELVGKAEGPFGYASEVYYNISVPGGARVSRKYGPHIELLANEGFPVDTEKILRTLDWILVGEAQDSSQWLRARLAQDKLFRVRSPDMQCEQRYKQVFYKYQAFIFGFYYQLLGQIISFEKAYTADFFYGIWGTHSTSFLAMCTQLGRCLRRDEKATRSQILYILAAMYNGRYKTFYPNSTLPKLVGVIGQISVLTLPLIRITDDPKEISKIALVDVPIVDLVANSADGDLMASEGGGPRFEYPSENDHAVAITRPASPASKWTVYPCMSTVLKGDRTDGVVMAARCGKRLVGWFNPLAADVSFLGSAYVTESYSEETVVAFEVKDEHWEAGKILQPNPNQPGSEFGVVHSHGSSSLRYAAAGFYAERGEEIAIARTASEFSGAFDRVQAQDQGIVIA
ncbi:hypothetical protein AG0111_0g3596 [Alternaria gaisen]|uniref:Uncharacterized protein n=1 Tax=Alternaria gaisen TaxID=167740 RepID=A0ACB6FWK2_9PLEO|nr:hypothetical protein AG0111_0g3596 [Alternaria gaisen]